MTLREGQVTKMLEIPPLPASTILFVEVGSTAHGTGIPAGEDNDEMGVMIEAPYEVLGFGERGFATESRLISAPGELSRSGATASATR